jgi:hypothetical protein
MGFVLIVLAVVVVIAVGVVVYRRTNDIGLAAIATFFTGVAAAIIVSTLISVTVGMLPHYSDGVRQGYITKFSRKGFIWKTWEGEMQIGAGQQAALQEPHKFSVSDSELVDYINATLGKRVEMVYNEWGIMPCSIGESGYQATSVQVLQ